MGLLGKYTTYVGGVATDAHKLLAKLYPDSPFAVPLTAGDEVAAQNLVKATATANVNAQGVGGLLPANGVQQGDLGMFPNGVPLGFGASPDVTAVAWTNPGDPSNPYFPDITSPGPGKTDGKDKATNPNLATTDVPHTNSDPAGQDLRVPLASGPAIYSNNTLGNPQKLGDSGGNA